MKSIALNTTQKNIACVCVIALVFFILVYAVYTILPVHDDANPPITWGFSVDWKGWYRPDTQILLSGRSPYAEGGGLVPPWAYLALIPFALLEPALGAAFLFVTTYMVYCAVLLRAGAKPWMVLGVIASPWVFYCANNGNIDWLIAIGFVLPPQIGLFFVCIKPQMGAGIALFWLIEAWRIGKLREVIRVFGPVAIAYLLSFAIFGLWPLRITRQTGDPYNASMWPVGLFVGIPLLIYALIKQKRNVSIAATPLIAPYTNMHSYAILLFAFLDNEPGFLLMTALSWMIYRF